jgi:hypothetical protein
LDAQKESTKENGTLPNCFALAGNPMPPTFELDVSLHGDQPFFLAIIKKVPPSCCSAMVGRCIRLVIALSDLRSGLADKAHDQALNYKERSVSLSLSLYWTQRGKTILRFFDDPNCKTPPPPIIKLLKVFVRNRGKTSEYSAAFLVANSRKIHPIRKDG